MDTAEPQQNDPNQIARERKMWGRRVKSVQKFIKEKYDEEVAKYVKMYRHEFEGILPGRFLKTDDIDVNVVFPRVKALIPNLYFQDPKVFVKSLQEKIVIPVNQLQEIPDPITGIVTQQMAPVPDPMTGEAMVEEFDGPRSALIFQNALNRNIRLAKAKGEVKSAILDAHVGFYGAIKTGWDNEQGVFSMGEGAPPSFRETVVSNMAYSIRLQPWNVLVDLADFYNPKWIAIRMTAHPDQLKADKRLKNTDKLKGNAKLDVTKDRDYFKDLDEEDKKITEYYEVYVKPSAQFPQGKFLILSDEVENDYLFEGEWPYAAKDFPIKILYFNADPEGGLPIPDVRYYANHQKAKLNLRKLQYEYVQRTLPLFGINSALTKNPEYVKKVIESGRIPRVIDINQPVDRVFGGVSFNQLSPDFNNLNLIIDDDIGQMTGLDKGVATGGQSTVEFAGIGKIADQNNQIKQKERSDIVSDFLKAIVTQWAEYYQEFAGDDNYTPIEGEKFPTKWSVKQIQGQFDFDLKPFSMTYEDPVVRRRQWVDLLNLLAAPPLIMGLAQQGAQVDLVKIVNRILETYDERDVESFMIDAAAKPENQVAQALQENQAMSQGQPAQVQPTDNHKVHIILHGLIGDIGLEHMVAHQQAMEAAATGQPGGGNAEGLPLNGSSVNQDLLKAPLQPSPTNQSIAQSREASKPLRTR